MGDLFGQESGFSIDREELRDKLRSLAVRGIYIGGSSWKYEGWVGQIYDSANYTKRGRFSKKLFDESCLKEYASIFPAVCGDFAFYQFPSDAFWAKLFQQTQQGFKWGFKVPEQITVARWPMHPRYGALAGERNLSFLDANLFVRSFLKPLDQYRAKVGVLIFEFGALDDEAFEDVGGFVAALSPFLSALPSGWRFGIEIETPSFSTLGILLAFAPMK